MNSAAKTDNLNNHMAPLHKDEKSGITYEIVIGIETHVQILSASKAFCSCENSYGGIPNTRVCPVCLALPGAQPKANRRLFEAAALAGLAFKSQIAEKTGFARKNYVYPDLPKGYQITQSQPICQGGFLEFDINGQRKKVELEELHMEEDVGKILNIDDGEGSLYLDYNRSGAPLIEIVSKPQMSSPEEAGAYAQALREIVRSIGISNGDMEEGSLRCDANINLRIHKADGSIAATPIAEIKNMNSFRAMRRALAYETQRQLAQWQETGIALGSPQGGKTTRRWDEKAGVTMFMRNKGPLDDYRFFPEPDLKETVLSPAFIAGLKPQAGELPLAMRDRLKKSYGLSDFDCETLSGQRALAAYFEKAAKGAKNPKKTANWILTELLAKLKRLGLTIEQSPISPQNLRELADAVEEGIINGKQAKEVFERMAASGMSPKSLIGQLGLAQTADSPSIEALVEEILKENPAAVADYRAGKDNALKFLMGQLMKKSKGKANPDAASKLFMEKLGL